MRGIYPLLEILEVSLVFWSSHVPFDHLATIHLFLWTITEEALCWSSWSDVPVIKQLSLGSHSLHPPRLCDIGAGIMQINISSLPADFLFTRWRPEGRRNRGFAPSSLPAVPAFSGPQWCFTPVLQFILVSVSHFLLHFQNQA